jgi:hypothetical protein
MSGRPSLIRQETMSHPKLQQFINSETSYIASFTNNDGVLDFNHIISFLGSLNCGQLQYARNISNSSRTLFEPTLGQTLSTAKEGVD